MVRPGAVGVKLAKADRRMAGIQGDRCFYPARLRQADSATRAHSGSGIIAGRNCHYGNRMPESPHFDPISPLFTHQHARPDMLDHVAATELGAAQRLLLTTDGTVTTLLETLALEPVHVAACDATPLDWGDVAAWLETGPVESLRERRIFLVGQRSGRRYVMARSAIVENRAGERFFQALRHARSGLGEALRSAGMETTRELLWYGAVRPAHHPDWLTTAARLVSRAYRIRHRQQPLLFIHETFLPDTAELLGPPPPDGGAEHSG